MPMTALQRFEDRDLAELNEVWKASLRDNDYAANTIKKYPQVVAHFLTWYEQQEHVPLTLHTLTPITLVSYRNALQQQKATSTVNVAVNALRTWCTWLMEEGYLPSNPAARFHLVDQQAVSHRDGLKPSQVNTLLQTSQRSREKTRNYAIVQLLLQTGLRLSECAHLTFGDLTIGERGGLVEVRAGKGNKARSVPLNSTARLALAEYLGPRIDVAPTLKAVATAWPRVTPSVPLWLSQKKGKLTASAIAQMIAELVEDCGVHFPQETSAHTLRHTFAHNYLNQHKGDIVGLATLLGHSSLDTTMLYSQPSVNQLAARVEEISLNAYL
ncbi:MAG: tyrosine-type recombinase/integrase [Ktedonobacteraceae bacterium]|nr:tyrosine-type recombinase/integrase [Ktedonobacteraceae bacterium]